MTDQMAELLTLGSRLLNLQRLSEQKLETKMDLLDRKFQSDMTRAVKAALLVFGLHTPDTTGV
jgi:hypothetical protein